MSYGVSAPLPSVRFASPRTGRALRKNRVAAGRKVEEHALFPETCGRGRPMPAFGCPAGGSSRSCRVRAISVSSSDQTALVPPLKQQERPVSRQSRILRDCPAKAQAKAWTPTAAIRRPGNTTACRPSRGFAAGRRGGRRWRPISPPPRLPGRGAEGWP
jgi:hypothetical protein